MNKSQVKLLIGMVIIILGIIMSIIAFAMSTVVNKDALLEKDIDIIVNNYTVLTNESVKNNDLRKEISTKLANFSKETYKEGHDSYVELLKEYTDNISKITESVNLIDPKCGVEYEETRVNIICISYKMLYEEAINLYVENTKKYNENITNYNETSEEDYPLFEALYTEYIDIDGNGVFKGIK